MGLRARRSLLQAALILNASFFALAQHHHGGEEEPKMESSDMSSHKLSSSGGGHHMAPPSSEDVALWEMQSYWSLHDHASLMYAHIAVMILAWVVILPISE